MEQHSMPNYIHLLLVMVLELYEVDVVHVEWIEHEDHGPSNDVFALASGFIQ